MSTIPSAATETMSIFGATPAATSPCYFLDRLPAEMRNRIYDLALTHNRGEGGMASVALLRTCKQINQEATELFYERSKFTFRATGTLDYIQEGEVACSTSLTGDIHRRISNFESATKYYDALPPSMLRVPKIQLEIDFPFKTPLSSRTWAAMLTWWHSTDALVLALTSFLNSSSRQHEVTISLHVHQDWCGCAQKLQLGPLTFLRHPFQVISLPFDGTTPTTLLDSKSRSTVLNDFPLDPIATYRTLRPQLKQYLISQAALDLPDSSTGKEEECPYRSIVHFACQGIEGCLCQGNTIKSYRRNPDHDITCRRFLYSPWPHWSSRSVFTMVASIVALQGIMHERANTMASEEQKRSSRREWLRRYHELLCMAGDLEVVDFIMSQRVGPLCTEIGVWPRETEAQSRTVFSNWARSRRDASAWPTLIWRTRDCICSSRVELRAE